MNTKRAKALYGESLCYRFAFSFALSELYAQEKAKLEEDNKMKKMEEVLVERGCRVWEKGDKRRIYVDLENERDMKNVFDFEWAHVSRSGWRSGFTLEGEEMSGCKARAWQGRLESLTDGKIFFDCPTERWLATKHGFGGKVFYEDITNAIQEFLPASILDQVA